MTSARAMGEMMNEEVRMINEDAQRQSYQLAITCLLFIIHHSYFIISLTLPPSVSRLSRFVLRQGVVYDDG
jgi:hypothetical protein